MYSHINILVAEDNEHDAFFLKRAFQKAAINVGLQFVEDGEQALQYLGGTPPFENRASFPFPHLLLLDLKMPNIDGFGVLERIRAEPELCKLPVIIFSSSDEPRDVDRAHQLGANGYTRKPGNPSDLLELVQDIERYWLRRHCFPTLPVPAHSPHRPS